MAALGLAEVGGELGEAFRAALAVDRGDRGTGQDGGQQVATAAARARVGELVLETLPQRAELGGLVIALRGRRGHLGGEVGRQCFGAQPRERLRVQGAHPELFRVVEVDVEVAVIAGEAAGRTEVEPAGGVVTRSFIPLGIDETLGHEHRVTVRGQPVGGEPAGAAGEQVAGQVGRVGALHQQEKTAVLRDETQPRSALGLGPAEPAIAWAQVQRGAGPAEQGEPAAVGGHGHVAQRLAHEGGVVEVMVRA